MACPPEDSGPASCSRRRGKHLARELRAKTVSRRRYFRANAEAGLEAPKPPP